METPVTSGPSRDRARALLEGAYGLTGTLERLPGENENYRVDTPDGRRFVLKIAGSDQTAAAIELETQVVELAHAADIGIAFPRVVRTASGAVTAEATTPDGPGLRARLLDFVPGVAWSDAPAATRDQRIDLGRTLARFDRALDGVRLPAARRTHRWDLTAAGRHRSNISLIADPQRRRIVEALFHLHAAVAQPRLARLPHGVIHGDANDENVFVDGGRVSGLIDFGDCLLNPMVCELAIALPYAMLDADDPLARGADVVAGYDAERPLSLAELQVLFPLVCGRLAVTVTVCAERRRIDPDRSSWFVTEDRAWALISRLSAGDPADAGRRLAAPTGLDPHPTTGAPKATLLEARRRRIGRALSIAYDDPLKIVRGSGPYLYDDRGRPFLDLVNNVCHVGHCHPRVVEAGQRQMAVLNTNTRYLYDGLTEYADRLCATLPDRLDTCFLLNSGSEANELALRLAMTHTGRRDLLVVDGAYHGHTSTLIAISPYKFMGRGGPGRPESWVHVVPIADGYRGRHRGRDLATGRAYGDDVGRVLDGIGRPVAGFITESLLSCGGQVIPPPGYLARAFEHVRAVGGLCIIDEVQVGFGRVGSHVWAFQLQDVVPDIVVMGKPIGNGHPMAAVVTTRAIADSFANGMEFFTTFGGNPVSCAIGMAVLDVMRDEALQAHALDVGTRLRDGLAGLMDVDPRIGDVRGEGLFIGVELVRDRLTLEPARDEADRLVNLMKERGMLLSTDGPHGNVIKIKPPMVLDAEDVDMVVRSFADVLAEIPR